MRLVKLTQRMVDKLPAGSRARKCPLCKRAVQEGQWVFHHRLPADGFVDTSINIHRACTDAAAVGCPPDEITPTNPAAAVEAHRRESRRAAAEDRAARAA